MAKTAFGLYCVAGLFIASSAIAADLPTRKSPPVFEPSAAFTWTGFYFGGNVGGAFSSNSFSADPTPGTNINAAAANAATVNGTGKSDRTSFTGGGQAGYNQQFSNLVIGIEGDVEYIGGRRTRDTGNVAIGGVVIRDVDTMGSDWMATVRARLGWAMDRTLIYATGGAAFADMQFSRSQNWSFADGCAIVGGLNSCHNGSASNNVGWTAGGGIEYALTNNWILRAEYLYADFGKVKFTTANSGPGFAGAPQTITHSDRNTVQLARIGVDYKF
jgi:outer membrane immunogenic protein